MDYVRLGKTNLMVSRVAMGVQSIAKQPDDEKFFSLLKSAYNQGINFFDTSHENPQSEKLLRAILSEYRDSVIIATKTSSQSSSEIFSDVQASLEAMQTDCIDIYQYNSDVFIPKANGTDGIYKALKNLKQSGKIKHIGFATETVDTAKEAVYSGLYETLQFPFSMLSSDETRAIVSLCEKNDVGFIAMQPLCGGVVANIPLAFGFLHQYENVIPLWGAKTQEELNQILYFNKNPPQIDGKFKDDVEKIRSFFN